MRKKNTSYVAAAVMLLALTGCTERVSAEPPNQAAAKVVDIPGSSLRVITLIPAAISRIGLRTEPVKAAPAGDAGIVPFSALLYDPNGAAWVYTSPAPRTFVRTPVVVDRIDDDTAYLKKGPKTGLKVVTVGASELYGTEYGVGGEEK
jgi:hypothetical protein